MKRSVAAEESAGRRRADPAAEWNSWELAGDSASYDVNVWRRRTHARKLYVVGLLGVAAAGEAVEACDICKTTP